ncbi:MAG: hypothetical protein ACRD2S_08675 [Terriglobales bacterium]
MFRTSLITLVVFLSAAAFAQSAADSPYQVHYASNLTINDSFINLTNTGANGAQLNGPGSGAEAGNLCINTYVLDPGEEEIACCSCLVTPDALASMSVNNDLISNTTNGVKPTSVVIKLIATLAGAGGSGTSCANSATSSSGTLATGMEAWMTTTHTITTVKPGIYPGQKPTITVTPVVTETSFIPSTLSAGEYASLTNRCNNIVGNDSGFGICRSCRVGGQ